MEHTWPTYSTCFKHLMHHWGKCLHHSGNYVVYSFGLATFTRMQGKVFSLNLMLKYVKSSQICIQSAEPDLTKSDCSEMDHLKPNHVRFALF